MSVAARARASVPFLKGQASGRARVTSLPALVALLAATLLIVVPVKADEGLRVVGRMPSGSAEDVVRLLVDPVLNLGFTVAQDIQTNSKVFVYDLKRMTIVKTLDAPLSQSDLLLATVDVTNHRLLFPPVTSEVDVVGNPPGCPRGPQEQWSILEFDLVKLTWGSVPVGCTNSGGGPSAVDQFVSLAVSYDAKSNKMYAVGQPYANWAAHQTSLTEDRVAQILLLREMDPKTGAVDWEVNLSAAGCDGVRRSLDARAFVQRFGDDVLSYCYGPEVFNIAGFLVAPGYAVRVPLEDGKPVPDEQGLPSVRLTPTLPGGLFPVLDPGSGRMLLLTNGSPNGNGVWVYDAIRERFVGLIASGLPPTAHPYASIYFGINELTGRTYFQSDAGLLVADVRAQPLPSGVTFPYFQDNGPTGAYIAVAPQLRRLFVPLPNDQHAFLVLEDDIPEPAPPPQLDPDRGTADIPEQAGKTDRVFSGVGGAYGAHLLNTGGLNRAAENLDLSCPFLGDQSENAVLPKEVRDFTGGCLEDVLLTAGNRELFLGSTATDLGSESGSFATASAANVSTTDTATDADFRRLAACFSEDLARRGGAQAEPVIGTYSDACAVAQAPLKDHSLDFSGGTRGPEGKGFPVRGSDCQDQGGGKADGQQEGGLAGFPSGVIGSSSVECNLGSLTAIATAKASAFAIPDVDAPALSIARAWSSVTTEMKPEGLTTTETADASGIMIADFSIGHVSTVITTVAKGRTGSTKVTFSRTISNVRGPGISCPAACDPAEVVDAINRAFGLRVRARLPEADAFSSPHGYQALAIKDSLQHDSDRTMNDDDTFEVAGLEIVFYNDGSAGRSRVVLQLAGVRGESRYGIFLLPEGLGGDVVPPINIPGSGPIDLGGPALPGANAPTGGGNTVIRTLRQPAGLVTEGVRLIVSNPREFGLLFAIWSLFAIPVYLRFRRRSLWRALRG